MKISVIGLGKLGAPLAACLAYKGFGVIGVDMNSQVVEFVQQGKSPVMETGLDELIRQVHPRLTATSDYATAIAQTQVTFIIVPTPSEPHGGFSIEYVMEAVEKIGVALRDKDQYHLVVLTSTVLPGVTRDYVKPRLEQLSGKECGRDFGLCYNPEFIALGSVIRDMLNPDLVLIGESDKRAGDMLEEIQRVLCDNTPHFSRMNFVNAELSKLAVNTFVTTKISYANMLAEICEKLPGADVDSVTSAIGKDTRIGSKYLKGALGYGGPCFPRDNIAFAFMARNLGVNPLLADATQQENILQAERLLELVVKYLPLHGTVAILGLAYKPNTCVIDESNGLRLATMLATNGARVIVFDPQANSTGRTILKESVRFANSTQECLREADVIVLATPWEEFRTINVQDLKQANQKPVIVDCWRILDSERFAEHATYVAIGRNSPYEPPTIGSKC